MTEIRLGAGLPELLVKQLGLREGRQAFEDALRLQSLVLPVIVLNEDSPEQSNLTSAFSAVLFPGSGGGLFSQSELRNPVGSQRTVYLDRVDLWTVATTTVSLRDNALASQLAISEAPAIKQNKQVGGGAGLAELRRELKAAALTGNQRWEKRTDGQGNLTFDCTACGPFRIDPGFAIGVQIEILAPGIGPVITYQWREVNNA